ncbi:MAG TPA: SRPBCC domain-containing protein [Flavitalea sp.]|nr:SRPBCC domain-containing protein [Flavitalea sp.]
MEKQQFRILIDAPRENVWDILWNDQSYREWTSVFSEGSRAETDWAKGSKVLFLSGSGEGMVSRIKENISNEFMSIEHLGIVKGGLEDLESNEVKQWAGALENYTLRDVNGKTELIVDMDVTDEYKDYFQNIWPKALEKVKVLAEKSKVASPGHA